jgi:hypothetical protein
MGEVPRWTDPKQKRLGCLITEDGDAVLLMMFNAGTQDTEFMFPSAFPLILAFAYNIIGIPVAAGVL